METQINVGMNEVELFGSVSQCSVDYYNPGTEDGLCICAVELNDWASCCDPFSPSAPGDSTKGSRLNTYLTQVALLELAGKSISRPGHFRIYVKMEPFQS